MSETYKIVNPNILSYLSLFEVRIPNRVGIVAKYRNAKVYTYTAFALQTPLNPLGPRAQTRWETRTDPLWWSAIAHKNLQNHRVVRSWAARRMRIAFEDSLKKKGWAADGTPMKGSGHKKPLYGTLQMSSADNSIKVSLEQLKKETDFIVEHIIRKQGDVPYCEGKEFKGQAKRRQSTRH